MQVILLFILLVIIILAFIHWYISIPILAFLSYLGNLILCTPQQLRSPIRHILWWLFLILLVGGMYHREDIDRFYYNVKSEYWEFSDPIFDHCLTHKEDLTLLDATSIPHPEELYGGLEVGMSPMRAAYHLMRHEELLHDLKLDSIELYNLKRHYSDNNLYGISFTIAHNGSSENLCQDAILFFSKKYGAPHHAEKTEHHHIAQWKFAEKHIVIIKPHNSYHGDLFIYNPALLQQKIDAHYLEIERQKARILEEKRREEEAERKKQIELEEALKKEEQNNLRLQESL